jgi:hypothetical protein
MYPDCCTRNERSGIAWLKAVIWKLREIRREDLRKEDYLCV